MTGAAAPPASPFVQDVHMAFLVVGAGFAGAVYARHIAEAGHAVEVIDRRGHIGGNAYDAVDDNGIRVHRYGPHLFHTNNAAVVQWLSRFGAWTPYQHRVRARLPDGRLTPLPVNRDTINDVFGVRLTTADEVEAFLRRVATPIAAPRNAAEHLRGRIGDTLTDLFFRPYTRKMWGLELEDMAASVVQRLPIRLDADDRYFPGDQFQMLPQDGYTAIFRSILDHPRIRVSLGTPYVAGMERGFRHCFNSMPIDEFFDGRLGELPYRSIRFHAQTRPPGPATPWTVTNYTDDSPCTRETDWRQLPGHHVADRQVATVTVEEPCDYRDNHLERYYPVRTADNRHGALYRQYAALAASLDNVTFIGRCGTYQYLDMDQVINQSMLGVSRFLATRMA